MNTNFYNPSESKSKFSSLLIIEKDEIQRKGITVALMDYFFEIRSTNHPIEALAAVKEKQFEFIISEINFDSISGIELIEKLHKYNPDAEIITITSPINDEIKFELMHIGTKIIIEKPIEIKMLLNSINKLKNK